MKKLIIIVLIALIAYLGIKSMKKEPEVPAPAPTEQSQDIPSSASASSAAATTALATELKIRTASITIVSAVATEWSDSCLGLGGPAESCLAAMTPGWEIVLSANEQTYIYRTDLSGSVVRKATARTQTESTPKPY